MAIPFTPGEAESRFPPACQDVYERIYRQMDLPEFNLLEDITEFVAGTANSSRER